jgi:flagella synthesis protein FlgN
MSALHEHLSSQKHALGDLIALLDQELHLISTRDPEKLTTLLHDKETVLDDIQQRDGEIQRWYGKALEKDAVDSETKQLINECQALVKQCKFRTEINQTAVANGQLRLEHLRNILNQLRAKESMTYDKSGKTQSRVSSTPIKA